MKTTILSFQQTWNQGTPVVKLQSIFIPKFDVNIAFAYTFVQCLVYRTTHVLVKVQPKI